MIFTLQLLAEGTDELFHFPRQFRGDSIDFGANHIRIVLTLDCFRRKARKALCQPFFNGSLNAVKIIFHNATLTRRGGRCRSAV